MSAAETRQSKALVVGTAGHIDHGKTSLIRALTGVDTDQLKEEKQRGISIDLGFAELALTGGPTISFVDVPGHERFVRNMVAGASGIEAVMLIVAANESVMPQTVEHLEICELLGIQQGLLVLTKIDLVNSEQLNATKGDVEALTAGTFLEGAPLVEVSAVTGSGIGDLITTLTAVVTRTSNRKRDGLVRLPVDRSFAVRGFGTVVTGTLASGSVKVGDLLEIHPGGQKVRVRAMQAQHQPVEQGGAGQRLAVNLAGVDHHSIQRGFVVTTPDSLASSRILDVKLRWLEENVATSSKELFLIHSGTTETSGRIHSIGDDAPGNEFARMRLRDAIVAVPGDRLIIRRPSPARTVAGAQIVDAFPPQRLNRPKALARLRALYGGNVAQQIEFLVSEAKQGLSILQLVRVTGLSRDEILKVADGSKGLAISSSETLVTNEWVRARRSALLKWLKQFHGTHPNAPGAPLTVARLGLPPDLATLVVKDLPEIRIQGDLVALKQHQAALSAEEQEAALKMEMAFRSAGFQPPSRAEVLANSGLNAEKARSLMETLIKSKRLVRLPDDLIFHADVINHIRESLAPHKGRKFSVAEFKGWINISRKFAIPLLEYMDQTKITRREGDFRIVV